MVAVLGRIRDIYNIPAVGDIRHVLCAMADEEDEGFFSDLLNYRFEGSEDVGGHNLRKFDFLGNDQYYRLIYGSY